MSLSDSFVSQSQNSSKMALRVWNQIPGIKLLQNGCVTSLKGERRSGPCSQYCSTNENSLTLQTNDSTKPQFSELSTKAETIISDGVTPAQENLQNDNFHGQEIGVNEIKRPMNKIDTMGLHTKAPTIILENPTQLEQENSPMSPTAVLQSCQTTQPEGTYTLECANFNSESKVKQHFILLRKTHFDKIYGIDKNNLQPSHVQPFYHSNPKIVNRKYSTYFTDRGNDRNITNKHYVPKTVNSSPDLMQTPDASNDIFSPLSNLSQPTQSKSRSTYTLGCSTPFYENTENTESRNYSTCSSDSGNIDILNLDNERRTTNKYMYVLTSPDVSNDTFSRSSNFQNNFQKSANKQNTLNFEDLLQFNLKKRGMELRSKNEGTKSWLQEDTRLKQTPLKLNNRILSRKCKKFKPIFKSKLVSSTTVSFRKRLGVLKYLVPISNINSHIFNVNMKSVYTSGSSANKNGKSSELKLDRSLYKNIFTSIPLRTTKDVNTWDERLCPKERERQDTNNTDCKCIEPHAPTILPKLHRLVKRYNDNAVVIDYKTKPECIPPCPRPRADDCKDFCEQKCLPVLECNDCPKICNDERCSVPLRRLKPRIIYKDPERVCPPPCIEPDVTLMQLVKKKKLPPIPQGDCFECKDDRPTCDPKLERLVKRYDDNAVVIDYKTIPECIPPCPRPRADDCKDFCEQKCLPVLECNDCPKVCNDERCSVPLRRLKPRIIYKDPERVCPPPCIEPDVTLMQLVKKKKLPPIPQGDCFVCKDDRPTCDPKLERLVKRYDDNAVVIDYKTIPECIPPCPRPRADDCKDFCEQKCLPVLECNDCPKVCNDERCSVPLRRLKPRIIYKDPERVCPPPCIEPDVTLMQLVRKKKLPPIPEGDCFECKDDRPTCDPKLERLVKRYDDNAVVIDYKTIPECIPPCPRPRADDCKDFCEQKCLPVLECNDCPKVCNDERCSVPLRRLKPRIIYKDPERVCPPPCIEPDVTLMQLVKKKKLPPIPQGDCFVCKDDRPTCDPKLERLVKRYDDNAVVIDYKTIPECIPPCPRPRADDCKDFCEQKCLPVLECNDCPKVCNDERCSVPLRRLKPRIIYKDPERVCPPPCIEPDVTLMQLVKKKKLPPIPEGDCYECKDDRPTCDPKLERLVKRYDDNAVVIDYKTIPECIPPCPRPRADDCKDFYEQKCLPVLECNDCPKICNDDRCSVPLRRLTKRYDTNIETVYPAAICDPPCGPFADDVCQIEKKRPLKPMLPCNPKLKNKMRMRNYFSKNKSQNRHYSTHRKIQMYCECCPCPPAKKSTCPTNSLHTSASNLDKHEKYGKLKLDKGLNKNIFTTSLHATKDVNVWDERLCPQETERQDSNNIDCKCIEPQIPSILPKLQRLVKRYDDNVIAIDYKTKPECIPPCPRPRADDNKDFYKQKCLPALECNDCPKICHEQRCSVPLVRLKPRAVYRDPERVCPSPCVEPEIIMQLIKKKKLPPVPEGGCQQCKEDRPTCDPKLERLVKRYDDNAVEGDYKTKAKCTPPCPRPRADDSKDFNEQKCLPVLECNDCPKVCNDSMCSVPLRRLKPRMVHRKPEPVCHTPCGPLADDVCQIEKKRPLKPMLPYNPKLKDKPHMKNYFPNNKIQSRDYRSYRITQLCSKDNSRCNPCPSCKPPAEKTMCLPPKVEESPSLCEKIVQYFKARPNCPHPDAYKKEILERKALAAAEAVGKQLCPKRKSNCRLFSTFIEQELLPLTPMINTNNLCMKINLENRKKLPLIFNNSLIRGIAPDNFVKNSFGIASNYLINKSLNINKSNNFRVPIRYYSSFKNRRLLGNLHTGTDNSEQQELVNKILDAIKENIQFTENDPLGNINDTYQALFKDLSQLSNTEFESICNLAASNPIEITYNNKFTLIPAIYEESLENKTTDAIKSFCRTARFLQGLSYQEYEAIEREKTQKLVRVLDNLLELSRKSKL